MNLLNFISEIITAIAWPIATICIILILKKPLSDLVPLLRSLKYKEIEIAFSERIEKVREKSEENLKIKSSKPIIPDEKDYYWKLIELSPTSAVLESWRDLESTMSNKLKEHDEDNKINALRAGNIEKFLLKEQIIDETSYDLITELRKLRNQIAHAGGKEVSKSAAYNFVMSSLLASMDVTKL